MNVVIAKESKINKISFEGVCVCVCARVLHSTHILICIYIYIIHFCSIFILFH
jgi:hypothetical protein